MKSFLEHLNEEVLPSVQVADGALDIEKPAVRAAINAALAGVTSQPAVTPYVVFNRLSKLLAQYHIILPKRFLEGDKGVEVFELRQFGHKMGMTDSGEFVSEVPSTHYLFLQYGIITPFGVTYAKPVVGGMFRVMARLVDKAELDNLLDMAEISLREEAECMQAIAKANAPKEPMHDITSDEKKKGNKEAVKTSQKDLGEEKNDLKDACWKGYSAKGLKKKGSRMVPNCVPVEEEEKKVYKVGAVKGDEKGDRYERRDYSTHSSIVKTHQGGKSTQNEWGGHSPLRVGKPAYIAKHFSKLKEETQLDELDIETYKRYKTAAKADRKVKKKIVKKANKGLYLLPHDEGKFERDVKKRKAGIKMVKKKLVKEEEQINEVGDTARGRKALGRYIKKAHVSGLAAADDAANAYHRKDYKELRKHNRTGEKREQGVNRAVDKLAKEETIVEKAPPGREKQVLALKKKFPKGSGSPFAIAWSSYKKSKGE